MTITTKEDIFNARDYLVQLINLAIKQPYINVPTDNTLEEELLRATQARDAFAIFDCENLANIIVAINRLTQYLVDK